MYKKNLKAKHSIHLRKSLWKCRPKEKKYIREKRKRPKEKYIICELIDSLYVKSRILASLVCFFQSLFVCINLVFYMYVHGKQAEIMSGPQRSGQYQ